MTLTPQRLQALGDAGAKASTVELELLEGFAFDKVYRLAVSRGGWSAKPFHDHAPARAAMAEAVLKEAGFYDLLAALSDEKRICELEIEVYEQRIKEAEWTIGRKNLLISGRRACTGRLARLNAAIFKAEGGPQ